MNKIRLLIVEDDDGQMETYFDGIENYNFVNDLKFEMDRAISYAEGLDFISRKPYDAAIIDLRLDSTNTSDAKGNALIREIIKGLRFPVFVVTGVPNELDSDLELSAFLRLETRGRRSIADLLQEIAGIYMTGITRVLGNRGYIDSILLNIFWKHISQSIDYWVNSQEDLIAKERRLSRYILNHIDEHLGYGNMLSGDNYAIPEFYIIPPIKVNTFTGDIFLEKSSGYRYILITPACDMEVRGNLDGVPVRNASHAILCKVVKPEEIDERFNMANSVAMSKKARDTLKTYIGNNKLRYHFLPDYTTMTGGFIDFQQIVSIPLEIDDSEYTRLASVSGKFLKDIISRYVNYMNRQGQPDLDIDSVI